MKQFDLEEIKRVISEKYNWESSAEWTNFHFKELSKAIEAATGDRLSEETLKRIFGKRKVNTENYQPQAFSMMVLSRFAVSLGLTPSKIQIRKRKLNKKNAFLLLAFFGVAILVFVFSSQIRTDENYSFSCKNSFDYLPFTASFECDISEIEDSVFSDSGRDVERFLPPGSSLFNVFFRNAGVFWVHFYTRSRILDSLKIVVYSKTWQGGYFPNNKPEEFKSFYDQDLYQNPDYFYASPEKLEKEGVSLKENYWTAYKYFSPFNKNLDSLTLETRVLNNATTGSLLCYDIDLMLIGDSGHVKLVFTQPKCSRYAKLTFSEKQMDGEFDNLEALSVDQSDWVQFKMITEGKKFNLFVSDKLIFSGKYEKPLGNLLGVVFSFFGSGKIDYLKLAGQDGISFYQNDFSQKKP